MVSMWCFSLFSCGALYRGFLFVTYSGYGGGHIEVSIFFSCQNYVTVSSVYYAIYEQHKGHGTI